MSFFNKFIKKDINRQSSKNIKRQDSNIGSRINKKSSVANKTKPPRKVLFDEETLNKQEFYRDKSTMKNSSKKIHSSLQIGTNGNEWSKMTTTTHPRKGHKNDYIKLDNPTFDGHINYLEKSITTNSIKTRGERVNRPSLTEEDLLKIKHNINDKVQKKKIIIKKHK